MECLYEAGMLSLRGSRGRTFALIFAASTAILAQPPQQGQRRPGGFVPGQQRPAGDPAEIAHGKALYGISCRGCHGADLRGGDMGGPNLLRSQLSLSDRDGEKIIPVIQKGVPGGAMPPIPMGPEDAKAVATFVRSILATIGGQGKPPNAQEPPTILVGDAAEGQAYFAAKCTSCHSATGDLQGIGTRIADPKMLQNTWVAGGARGGRGGPPAAAARSEKRTVTASVTPPGGKTMEGRLLRIDHFVVTLELADGSSRSFRREGDVPQVVIHDPLAGHRELLSVYTDKEMHNVTAYLVTLK
ncbi:MAG: c-type cytochrome [Acidobacteria bacterium]|nr:c-type cytochrome [Acidobacteriota bacterium]